MQIKKYATDEERIEKVSFYLHRITKLYGYKMPDPAVALELVKVIINDLGFIQPKELELAFKMVALEKLPNINIESYGKTLTVPMIAKVVKAYRKQVNLNTKHKKKQLSKAEKEVLNKKALLTWLSELETKPLNFLHYNLIDKYIYKFPDELKIRVYQEELENEKKHLENKKATSRQEAISIRIALGGNQLVVAAKTNARARLAREYVAEEIINYPEAERRIKEGDPLY